MRRIKPVCLNAHPLLYEKMEFLRKQYQDKNGISLSQMQLTNIIAKRVRLPKVPSLDLIGGINAKKKRRPY